MTEPDNDQAFQAALRQRLAEFSPPLNPAHWQLMQQKLRRKRYRRLVGLLASVLLVGSLGGYFLHAWWVAIPLPQRLVRPVAPIEPRFLPSLATQTPTIGRVREARPLKRGGSQPLSFNLDRLPAVLPLAIKTLPLPGSVNFSRFRPSVVPSPEEIDITRRLLSGEIGADSTTYRTLSRNIKGWSKVVIVCDLTSSMYPFSTQLMSWFRQHKTNRQVQGLVFFTDCDSLGQETGPGRAGQLLATRDRSLQAVLPLMLASVRLTRGNQESAENNIEALVYAQQQFPEATQLVLVADNGSAVKDLHRLKEIHKPVHVILCGTSADTTQAFQPDYYQIAQQSGGSLHTLEDDLVNLSQLKPSTWIRVAGRYYRLTRQGQFVLTSFRHRPKRLLGLFWY